MTKQNRIISNNRVNTYDDHVNEMVVASIPTNSGKHKKSNPFPAGNSQVVQLNQRIPPITPDSGKSSDALEYIFLKNTSRTNSFWIGGTEIAKI